MSSPQFSVLINVTHHIIIFLFIILNSYSTSIAQSTRIDSLKHVIKFQKEDTNSVNTLVDLVWEYRDIQTDSALLYASKTFEIAGKINWLIGIGKASHSFGMVYDTRGDIEIAHDYFFKELAIWKKLMKEKNDNPNSQPAVYYLKTLGSIGMVYQRQGNYPKALEFFLKALKSEEKRGNKRGIARNTGNIGSVYYMQGNYSEALKYYSSALKLAEDINYNQLKLDNFGNIGNVYYAQQDYSSALNYYFKALKFAEKLGNKNSMSSWLGNIGVVYFSMDDYTKALSFYLRRVKLDEEIGNKSYMAKNLGNIGALYYQQNKFHSAVEYFLKALQLSKQIGEIDGCRINYNNLSEIYAETGNYKNAYECHLQYKIYRDSLYNSENTKKLTRLEMQYEFDKKKIVEEQRKSEERRNKEEQISYRNRLQYSIILIIILTLITSVFIVGKIKVTPKIVQGLIFFSFLIFFEFLLVFADPFVEQWTGGAPGWKLTVNAIIAMLIYPLHRFFEKIVKKRLLIIFFLFAYTSFAQEAEIDSMLKSLTISMDNRFNDQIKDTYMNLSRIYAKKKRYKEAYNTHVQFMIYSDSLVNEENTKKLTRLEMQYEFDKNKIREDQRIKKETERREEKISHRNRLQYSVILIIILMLITTVLLFGKIKVNPKIAQGLLFFSFLLFFEFLLVLADPYVELWTRGAPGWKLIINAVIALLIYPMHDYLEGVLKKVRKEI